MVNQNIPETKKVIRFCSVDGCERIHYGKSYCTKHYAQWRQWGDPLENHRFRRGVCIMYQCGKPHWARGYCRFHYHRWWTYGNPTIKIGNPKTRCGICGKPAEAKKLCHRHYQRLKYRRSPEKIKAWERQQRTLRGEYIRARDRKAYARNPGPKLHTSRMRRLAKRANGSFAYSEWIALLDKYQYRCAYCDQTGNLTRDHMIPLIRGGPNTIDNIMPACLPYNLSKGTKTPQEWGHVPRQIEMT